MISFLRESEKVIAEGPYGIEQVLHDWLFFNDDRGLKIFKFCCGRESYGKERKNPGRDFSSEPGISQAPEVLFCFITQIKKQHCWYGLFRLSGCLGQVFWWLSRAPALFTNISYCFTVLRVMNIHRLGWFL